MKTQIILKKHSMLAAILVLVCTSCSTALAAPFQSGTRAKDVIVWENSGTSFEPATTFDGQQTAQAPQIIYDHAPQIIDDQTPQITYDDQPVYISGDCGCEQESCTDCNPKVGRSFFRKPSGAGPFKSRRCGCGKLFSCCSDAGKCEGDICKLELDKTEVTKKQFKTQQVSVCIPPVRLPWKKSCPPGVSKTRLVNKLSTEKVKVANCGYKWTLVEPEEPSEAGTPTPAEPQFYESTPVYDSFLPAESDRSSLAPRISTPEVSSPDVSVPEVSKPKVSIPEIPTPKVSKPKVSIPNVSVPDVSVPKVTPPKTFTPPQAVTPKAKAPQFQVPDAVPPPPPTARSMPWRIDSPSG